MSEKTKKTHNSKLIFLTEKKKLNINASRFDKDLANFVCVWI